MREGTGVSLAVGGLVAGFFTALAGILVVVSYVFVCVYAVVKLIGDAEGHPDPVTLIVGFVLLVSALVVASLVGVRFLGRSLAQRRRSGDDDF